MTSSERLKIGQFSSFWPVITQRILFYHVCGVEQCCEELVGGFGADDSLCNQEEVGKVVSTYQLIKP